MHTAWFPNGNTAALVKGKKIWSRFGTVVAPESDPCDADFRFSPSPHNKDVVALFDDLQARDELEEYPVFSTSWITNVLGQEQGGFQAAKQSLHMHIVFPEVAPDVQESTPTAAADGEMEATAASVFAGSDDAEENSIPHVLEPGGQRGNVALLRNFDKQVHRLYRKSPE